MLARVGDSFVRCYRYGIPLGFEYKCLLPIISAVSKYRFVLPTQNTSGIKISSYIFMRFNSSINDMLRGYVMAGPAFGVKVGTGGTLNGSQGAVQGSRDFDIDPAIESKDVGLAFAGGLEWRKFMLEARYVLGLTDIATDIYIHDDHLTNRSFSILVGLHLP